MLGGITDEFLSAFVKGQSKWKGKMGGGREEGRGKESKEDWREVGRGRKRGMGVGSRLAIYSDTDED